MQSLAWFTTLQPNQVIDDKCGHCLKNFKKGLLKGKTVVAHQSENGDYQCHVHNECIKQWFYFVEKENGNYFPSCPKCGMSPPLKNRVFYYITFGISNAIKGLCIGNSSMVLSIPFIPKRTHYEPNPQIIRTLQKQPLFPYAALFIIVTCFNKSWVFINMLNHPNNVTKLKLANELSLYILQTGIIFYACQYYFSEQDISYLLFSTSLASMIGGVLGGMH